MAEIQTISTLMHITRAGSSMPARAHRQQLPARVPLFTPEMVPATWAPAVRDAALLITQPDLPAARSMATDDLIDQLLEPLQVVPFLLGHRKTLIDGTDLLVLATAVAEMIQRDFPALRVPEICAALRRGCAGEWQKPGTIAQCSLPCLTGWLRAYSTGTRAQALHALQGIAEHRQQLSLPAPAINYPKEVAELAAWASDNATPEHPAGRFPEPLDQGNVLYKWLRSVGAFNGFKTAEQYERMWRKESLQRAQQPPDGLEAYRHGRRFWELLRAGKWHAEHPFADSVANRCRKRLLKEWILYHLGAGTNIEQHLQQLQAITEHRTAAA